MTMFGAVRPPIPAVSEHGGLQVRQAGALYVPVRGTDDHVHWAYEPKLAVGRIQLWCQDRRFGDAPRGASADVTTTLGFAPACEWCAILYPLPVRETVHDAGEAS